MEICGPTPAGPAASAGSAPVRIATAEVTRWSPPADPHFGVDYGIAISAQTSFPRGTFSTPHELDIASTSMIPRPPSASMSCG